MASSRRAALLLGLLAVVAAAGLPSAAAVVCQSYRSAADCTGRVTSSGECVWEEASRTCVVGAPLPPGRVAVTSIGEGAEPSFAVTSAEPALAPSPEGVVSPAATRRRPSCQAVNAVQLPYLALLTSRHSPKPSPCFTLPADAARSPRQDSRPAADPTQCMCGPPHPRRVHLRAAAQLGQGGPSPPRLPLLLLLLGQPAADRSQCFGSTQPMLQQPCLCPARPCQPAPIGCPTPSLPAVHRAVDGGGRLLPPHLQPV